MIIIAISWIVCVLCSIYMGLKHLKKISPITCSDLIVVSIISLTGPLSLVALLITVYIDESNKRRNPNCQKLVDWINKKL